MKLRLLFLSLLTACCLTASAYTKPSATASSPVDYVNPLMGTLSTYALSAGNTYPAIARPWGMNFWTPMTGKMGDGWTYVYTAQKIRGFKQTHQPSPWMNDYGQFALMPGVGVPSADEEARASFFSHKAEEARPYYYKAYLADFDVCTEFTATSRAALFRFTFPESPQAYLILDAFDRGSCIRVVPEERKIIGYSTRNSGGVAEGFKNYFVVELDTDFSLLPLGCDTLNSPAFHAQAAIGFQTRRGQQVHARVASSFISEEQAERNLLELGDLSLEALAEQGRGEWNEVLGRIEINDAGRDEDLRTFYSCLYRSVLFPRALHEVDAEGRIVHRSPYNGRICEGYLFGDTGFWDTFRALFPLLNLVYPDMSLKMQEGWANAYRESGFLPEWSSPGHRACMVGNNSASVVADAYVKGVRCKDAELLWQAVTHGASHELKGTSSGRAQWEAYNRLGYVPCDSISESAARTLEYAYDDWCILQLGKALGKNEKALRPYAQRALNYRNLYRPEYRLMSGRRADGKWQETYNPLKWGDAFTEGNAWHYTWSVFHDPQGLINLMGGRENFVQMLDSVFLLPPVFDESYYGFVIHEIREMQIMNMGNYAHGNQPIQHMIYLYPYAGQPWKAQYWVRQVMTRLYNAQADGYCGDEDNGQTSAWYVFSALGFYPVCPASDQYVLGTPFFGNITLHLPNGRDVSISAPECSRTQYYIKELTLDGKPYDLNYLRHADLLRGASLRFTLSDTPNLQRATSPRSAPYSFSVE